MDIDALRALVTFVDAGCNLTRAGEVLGLSQPAVHARLVGLGRSLEVTLYERRGRRLVLTEAGTVVLARAREVVRSADGLIAELRGDVDVDVVTVACGEGALVHVIAARVAALAKAKPGTLRFLIKAGPAAVDAVRYGDADVAVVAGPVAASAGLKGATIASTRLVAVGLSSCVPGARGRPLDFAALASLPLLVPPPGSPLRATLDDAAAAAGVRLRIAVEVSGWEAVARLAQLGVGVGVINDVVLTPGLKRWAIAGLPALSYRAWRRRGRGSDAVEALWDALLTSSPWPTSASR